MKKIDELLASNKKLVELFSKKMQPQKSKSEKTGVVLLWIFAAIGVIASIVAIVVAVHRFLITEYTGENAYCNDEYDDISETDSYQAEDTSEKPEEATD